MPNIFVAGQNRVLETLARNDANRRLEEDRLRREQIDSENRTDRDRSFKLQERQLDSLDTDRDERRAETARVNDANLEGKARAEANAKALAGLMDAYDAAKTPEERRQIGMRIINSGGKVLDETKPIEVSAGSTLVDPNTHKPIYTAPNRPLATPASEKDDPSLPLGTKRWIEQIASQAPSIEDARQWLSKGWAQASAAHPRQELGKAAAYLTTLYPSDMGGVRAPMGGAPEGAAPAGAPPVAAAPKSDVPPAVAAALANEPDNPQIQLSDGSVWAKQGSTITRVR